MANTSEGPHPCGPSGNVCGETFLLLELYIHLLSIASILTASYFLIKGVLWCGMLRGQILGLDEATRKT